MSVTTKMNNGNEKVSADAISDTVKIRLNIATNSVKRKKIILAYEANVKPLNRQFCHEHEKELLDKRYHISERDPNIHTLKHTERSSI